MRISMWFRLLALKAAERLKLYILWTSLNYLPQRRPTTDLVHISKLLWSSYEAYFVMFCLILWYILWLSHCFNKWNLIHETNGNQILRLELSCHLKKIMNMEEQYEHIALHERSLGCAFQSFTNFPITIADNNMFLVLARWKGLSIRIRNHLCVGRGQTKGYKK